MKKYIINLILFSLFFYSCENSKNSEDYELIESFSFISRTNTIAIHTIPSADEIEIKYVIWNFEKENPQVVTLSTYRTYFNPENFENFVKVKSKNGEYLVNSDYIRTILDFGDETVIYFKLPKRNLISEIMPFFENAGVDSLDYFNKEFLAGSILTIETISEIASKIDTNNIKVIRVKSD